MKKKLTLLIERELVIQLKVFAASKDITMSSLIEKAILNIIGKGDVESDTTYTKFGQYSIKSIPINKEITQKECEDISAVETVLPMKDLTEV